MTNTRLVALGLVLLASTVPFAAAVISRGTTIEGFATFYGGPQDGQDPSVPSGGLVNGACGYQQLSQTEWPFWNVVSIGPNNAVAYKGNKKGCGYCIKATCQGANCGGSAKPVTLWVTDDCPTCAPNQLNLNAQSFQNNFNSDLSVGRVNVTFEQVDCTPPGNMLAKVVKARTSEGGYIGFALMAVAGEGTITNVEVQGQGGTWQRMANLYGDVWEASNFGQPPLSIRTTDNYDVVLTAPNAIKNVAEGTYDLGIQYPVGGQATSPAPAPTAAPPSLSASGNVTGFGPGFIATPSGTYCDKQCFSQGLTASQFKKIGTQLSTFACGVNSGSSGVVSGYQLSNGTATCSVATGTTTVDSPDYTCLCQTQAQTQGLEPYNGTQCSQSCDMEIDGLTGSSVKADSAGNSYVCVPLAETSLLNRFGHTVNTTSGESCVIDEGTTSSAADRFSCFCLFTAPVTASRRLMLL